MGRVAPPIITSVGHDAINSPADVFIIQSLLNERLPKPHTAVPITGVIDPGTVLAIQAYQAVVMGMNPPTGHIAPGSATYYSLAARPLVEQAPPPTVRFGRVGIVPPDVLSAAIASKLRWRIPVSVTLAQWVVESAWGAAMPPDSNNPFGIKAVGSQPAVESGTREVVDGADVFIRARFRRFESLEEAFDQHGRLLASNPVYSVAMRFTHDPEAFADALTGVYATDPRYGYTLKWVINNYGFKQHDQ
ncbi:glucosaminidase domain-containing protein [Roseomonas xinghualingensis]|uniref:glucosaminidase domain-containing protein n=1 Tax=Roseomonas xinghualingensis TaxID=2986475 RepID=UPI0021F19B52|nr:glucosaminidase domain-containing protein [Roseomonas sp. SXEYE001]